SPLTGPAAGFGEPDPYVIGLAQKAFKDGLSIGGTNYSVEIVSRDGQSTPSVGSQRANDLVSGQKVDLMLATSTPETVNPVSDACEAAGVPCISTVVPWEAWYLGRGAKPGQPSPFKYTFHYCFGVEQFFLAYTHLWPQASTNKKVGVLYPNDADGNAVRGALAPLLAKAGFTIVDPGPYEDGTTDFSAQITKFKTENCQIFNTFPLPPDFATFWRQATQQGYGPPVAATDRLHGLGLRGWARGPQGEPQPEEQGCRRQGVQDARRRGAGRPGQLRQGADTRHGRKRTDHRLAVAEVERQVQGP